MEKRNSDILIVIFMSRTRIGLLAATIVCTSIFVPTVGAQPVKAVNGDWPLYRHDTSGTGYSPLAQITVQNVGGLGQAWSYRLQADTSTAPQNGAGRGRGG